MTVHELSGTADMGSLSELPCPHANAQRGYPDVGILFCPDCGAYIDKNGTVLFHLDEAEKQ